MFASRFTRRAILALAGSLGLATLATAAPPPLGGNPHPPPAPSPYAAHVLSLKPAGYWRLGEPKGPTAVDSSVHKHNGTYHNTLAFGLPGAIKHDPDRSIALDGKSYVEIRNEPSFSVTGRGMTVEAWLRVPEYDFPGETGQGDDPYVHWLGKGEKDQFEWGFRMYSKHKKDGKTISDRPNRISAYIWNPSAPPGVHNEGAGDYFQVPLKLNQWIHVVAIYDPPGPGAHVTIYHDGECRPGPPHKGALYSTYNIVPVHGSAPVRLGTRDLRSFLKGGLDEVAIYPRVLTAAEILKNFQLGTAAREPLPPPHRK